MFSCFFLLLIAFTTFVQNAPTGVAPKCPQFEIRRNCYNICDCEQYRNQRGKCSEVCFAFNEQTELPCTCEFGYIRKYPGGKCVEVSACWF